jgi:hypothetical protein
MEPEELFAHVTGLELTDGLSQEEIISQVGEKLFFEMIF